MVAAGAGTARETDFRTGAASAAAVDPAADTPVGDTPAAAATIYTTAKVGSGGRGRGKGGAIGGQAFPAIIRAGKLLHRMAVPASLSHPGRKRLPGFSDQEGQGTMNELFRRAQASAIIP